MCNKTCVTISFLHYFLSVRQVCMISLSPVVLQRLIFDITHDTTHVACGVLKQCVYVFPSCAT